ncbi:MAG TPA: tetratricopeptide repeat protein [Terriglobales bacterium]|nr:tetratricopeptide repeat protein [Terriglobales bacterium]
MRILFSVAFTLLPLALPAWPQFGSPGTLGGTVPLNVRVVYADDRQVPGRITVELLTSGGEAIQSGVTNEDGALHFSQVQPGDYQLEVRGPGIQTTRSATFTLYREQHFHSETVTVRPENTTKAEEAAGAPGTVSAASMNIPEAAKDAFRKGAEALKNNKLEEARQQFDAAVKEYPKYSAAYDGLGIVLARMGKNEEALADLHRAVELDDHNVQACLNLARLAYRSGKPQDSEAALNKAVNADPRNVEALAVLSEVQLRSRQYQDSVATEHKIHQLPHAGFGAAHLIAGAALQIQHLWREAATEYELYLKEEPNGLKADEARRRLNKVQLLAAKGS